MIHFESTNTAVEFLLKKGYPKRIIGNGGYPATLVGIQPLLGNDFAAIYRYRGGDCVHDLAEIKKYFREIN